MTPSPRLGWCPQGLAAPAPAPSQMSVTMVLCSAPCFNDALPHVLAMGTSCNGHVLAQFGFFI